MSVAKQCRVAELAVEGLRFEVQLQRHAGGGIGQQQIRRLAVQEVREELRAQRAARVGDLTVTQVRARLHIERADATVHEAFRAGHATRVANGGVGQLLIDAHVELRLAGAAVGEAEPETGRGRIERIERATCSLTRRPWVVNDWDLARGSRKGIGRKVTGADAVRQPVIGCPRDRRVGAEHRSRAEARARAGVAVDVPAAERYCRANRLARRLGDDVDGAGHRVGAPNSRRRPAHDLDLLDVVEVRRDQVPQHQAEEVEVGAAAVDQDELRVGQRIAGTAAGHLYVTRRELDDVDARRRA